MSIQQRGVMAAGKVEKRKRRKWRAEAVNPTCMRRPENGFFKMNKFTALECAPWFLSFLLMALLLFPGPEATTPSAYPWFFVPFLLACPSVLFLIYHGQSRRMHYYDITNRGRARLDLTRSVTCSETLTFAWSKLTWSLFYAIMKDADAKGGDATIGEWVIWVASTLMVGLIGEGLFFLIWRVPIADSLALKWMDQEAVRLMKKVSKREEKSKKYS